MPPEATSAPNGHSPIAEIRARTGQPMPGERGQTRSTPFALVRHGLGLPNPDALDAATYKKMELDPQVRAGIQIREMAILGKPPSFNYRPRNKADAREVALGKRMVDFLTWAWNNLHPNPNEILRNILSARRFGFSILEKVWASQRGSDGAPQLRRLPNGDFRGFVWIEKLKHLPPSSVEQSGIATDEFGNIVAVYQNYGVVTDPKRREALAAAPGVVYDPSKGTWRIAWEGPDVDRLLIYAANKEEGNWYGHSDHKAAYAFWYAKQAVHADRNILLERNSGVVIGEYVDPQGQGALETALDNVGPGGVLTVPQGSNVKLLEGWEGAVRGYHEALAYDDHMILRAYLVPSLAIGGGTQDTGSFARAASDFNSFLYVCRNIQLDVEELVESGFVKPLIDANFGPQESYPTFDFPELADRDRSELAQVWGQAVHDGYVDPAVDAAWLRQEMGVPEPAPEGHVFTRPLGGPVFGSGRAESGLDARLAAAFQRPPEPTRPQDAQRPQAPSAFERAESMEHNRLLIEALESEARVTIADAFHSIRDSVLSQAPTDASDAELARLQVDPSAIREALDALATTTLERVWREAAKAYAKAGLDAPSASVARVGKLAGRAGRGRVRAADATPAEALRSYREWAAALNREHADRAAAELAHRLRIRALQSFAVSMTSDEVARGLVDEFATYTRSQLDTVSRTTVMDYYNSARNASIDAAGDATTGVRFVGITDDDQTPFCRAINGRSIQKTNPLYERLRNAPFWYNCRMTVIPILAGEAWVFETDWDAWWAEHQQDAGGGFVTGSGV